MGSLVARSLTQSAALLASIFVGFYLESFWAFLIFLFISLYLINQEKNNDLDNQFKKIIPLIEMHTVELSIKRRQLTVVKSYGVVDDSKWTDEIYRFISTVLEPQVGHISMFEKNNERTKKLIEEATENYGNISPEFSEDMDPIEYEKFVSDLLNKLGWNARVTVATGDQGIDIVATRNAKKLVVQCKMYTQSSVGNSAVQEIIAGKIFEKADWAAVVTNSAFTNSARQLATSSGVFLLHHAELEKLDVLCGIANINV
jgi:restriction system protein